MVKKSTIKRPDDFSEVNPSQSEMIMQKNARIASLLPLYHFMETICVKGRTTQDYTLQILAHYGKTLLRKFTQQGATPRGNVKVFPERVLRVQAS